MISGLRAPRWSRARVRSLGRRLAYFWVVWSMLLLVHEAGHAWVGWRQGLEVRRVTVGVGPVLWRGTVWETETVLRLVPLLGITSTRLPDVASPASDAAPAKHEWAAEIARLVGGVLATLAMAIAAVFAVAVLERTRGVRWVLGRMVVADALVLTVFNLLPVPPLDGGRALIVTMVTWSNAPLSADALFWLQLGGLAVAIVPMMLWTRWTARIDAAAMRWGAPSPR